MTKNGDAEHAAVADRARLGIGGPDRFGLNKGLPGQAELLDGRLQADPEPPKRLERAARVLVRLARSGPGVRGREGLQLLRQRGAAELQTAPKPAYQAFKRFVSRPVKPLRLRGMPAEIVYAASQMVRSEGV